MSCSDTRKASLSVADNEAFSERVKGIEPSLEAWEASVTESEVLVFAGVAAQPDSACTSACTNSTDSDVEPAIDLPAEDDLTAALLMIERLPLSDDEKAEAVRRLLASQQSRT
jgi:hypothetical protein